MTDLQLTQTAANSALSFRVILDAMAKPGQPMPLNAGGEAPVPLFGAAAIIIQTLCDFQSPLWLAPDFETDAIVRFIKFHTGAPLTKEPGLASFGLMTAGADMPSIAVFAQGTHEYPDRSTTLIVQVESFNRNSVVLSGPGLKEPSEFGAAGLASDFWQQMSANHQSYPLGVDMIFVSPDDIACCPRSTRIALKEQA